MPKKDHPSRTTPAETTKPRSTVPKDSQSPLLATVALLLACILIINGIFLYAKMSNKDTDFPAKILTSEQSAHTAALDFKVKNVALNTAMDYAFTLPDDQVMLVLNVSITNRTGSPQHLIPVSQFFIGTHDSAPLPLHPSMYIKDWLPSGTLQPGQTASGEISFGVPKAATDLYLYVDTGWNNQAPVVFDVLR